MSADHSVAIEHEETYGGTETGGDGAPGQGLQRVVIRRPGVRWPGGQNSGPALERHHVNGQQTALGPGHDRGRRTLQEKHPPPLPGQVRQLSHGSETPLLAGDALDPWVQGDGGTQGTGHRLELCLNNVMRVATGQDAHV